MKMLYKIGGFSTGTLLSTAFVCSMDDVIYGQFRRNIVRPVQQVVSNKEELSIDDLSSVAQGSLNFASQFKPHAMGRTNVKALLLKDQDYATPQDHYFGYINKQGLAPKDQRDMHVLSNLNLEGVLPPYYNIETGSFDLKREQILDNQGNLFEDGDVDIFELARHRGVTINELEELMSDSELDKLRKLEKRQKYTKKDYEKLKAISVDDIVGMTKEEKKIKQYEDDQFMKDIVKIEKKPQAKKKKSQLKQKDLEIQQLLKNPQDLDYEKAMKLYDQQSLEAKEMSNKDKKRLRRLKRKAEQSSTENTQIQNLSQPEERKSDELATSIKIETPANNIGDDLNDLIK